MRTTNIYISYGNLVYGPFLPVGRLEIEFLLWVTTHTVKIKTYSQVTWEEDRIRSSRPPKVQKTPTFKKKKVNVAHGSVIPVFTGLTKKI